MTLWDILGPIPVGVFGQREKSLSGQGILLPVAVAKHRIFGNRTKERKKRVSNSYLYINPPILPP